MIMIQVNLLKVLMKIVTTMDNMETTTLQYRKVDKSISIKEDQRMITKEETFDVGVVKDTYLILPYIPTLKPSMMELLLKVQILLNFKLEEEEDVLEKL